MVRKDNEAQYVIVAKEEEEEEKEEEARSVNMVKVKEVDKIRSATVA